MSGRSFLDTDVPIDTDKHNTPGRRPPLAGGCAALLSEDMQHGRRIGGLEVVNPFL